MMTTFDAYTIDATGRYIGRDGFVVPANFPEFYDRFPTCVRDWCRGYVSNSQTRTMTREDIESELLLHLMSLPPESKHRERGFTDRIQLFSPDAAYGVTRQRFFHFVSLILRNRFIQVTRSSKVSSLDIAVTSPERSDAEGYVPAVERLVAPMNRVAVGMDIDSATIRKTVAAFNRTYGARVVIDDQGSHRNPIGVLPVFARIALTDIDRQRFLQRLSEDRPELYPVALAIMVAASEREAARMLGVDYGVFERIKRELRKAHREFSAGERIGRRRISGLSKAQKLLNRYVRSIGRDDPVRVA